ncbi:MAG: alpha/beta fold hydrolase, partial [Actinobacteria bacterium]|nr:alpha/beta fold hydrolase [Actinomycetota bacterium]
MPLATVGGAPLHYLEAGSGDPPLVLLHAFPLNAAMWEPQVADLSDRWRVIAPDLPGFGKSAPFPEDSAVSIDGMADVIAGLLDELDVPEVALGGLSLGGYVAFAFARRHRPRLRALVLADTRAGADSDE